MELRSPAREEPEAFLCALTEALGPLRQPIERRDAAMRIVREHLRADRAIYAEIEDGGLVVRGAVGRDGARAWAFGAALESTSSGEVISIEDVQSDECLHARERDALLADGVRATIVADVVKEGRRLASFGVESDTPRAWSALEVAIVRDAAERIWDLAQLGRIATELTLAEQRLREQLSKTLHDGLQQLLFAASLSLERATKRIGADRTSAELIERARGDVEEALASARSLSVELFPRALHDGGLESAVQWLTEWMRTKYALIVEVKLDADASIHRRDIRALVFEAIREILFNAVKHAEVERVSLAIVAAPDEMVRVEIVDRGVGFDPAALSERKHLHGTGLGLPTIRERLTLVGGRMDVESAPGRGATFRLTVPRGAPSDEDGGQEPVA